MKTLRVVILFALAVPLFAQPKSFTFTLNQGVSGSNAGINVNVPQLQAEIGAITSGNLLYAADMRGSSCTNQDCYFNTATFTGTWDNPVVIWQEIGNTTTYTITGTVSGTYNGEQIVNVPVVLTVNGVTFGSTGFTN